jgi:peroxiredoxin
MDSVARPGEAAPDFELPDLEGMLHRRSSLLGRILVINFWSADCPHSVRADKRLLALKSEWGDRVAVWSVACNRNERMQDLAQAAVERGVEPLLLDPDQSAADRYGVLTTPHIFLIDAAGILRYAGAQDDVTFGQPRPTRSYLGEAAAALLAGQAPPLTETPAFGCAIVRMEW